MEQKKLRVGFISNSPLLKTGLARNIKCQLPLLYKKDKYEIFLLNQSLGDGDPNYQRFPWYNEGVMKNFDQNRFNQDQGYQRYVSYGNASVGDWIVRNKLDVVIALDDAWAFDINAYIKSDWYAHMKQNFLFGITLDSLPILEHGKELARNCENFRVWSGFAERELKREDSVKYGHVKTLRGAINSEQFKPISLKERALLREKFGISKDEKIIMYLSRNQLRKNAFHANQEALAKWKKQNPDKKIRLLFHTKFNEPNGWPIEQIRKEVGLDKDDVLCTYFCRSCQDWNVQPYEGEDLDCHHCSAKKSRITAGIDSTVTEGDLNKIYNICDASCSSFTSGGQEYNVLESILAGLPSACPFYSSGEDFILSGFVKEIKGNYYREFNTSFRKFNPDIDSIVDFYSFVWKLKDEDRDILVKNAREWAIKEFDEKNVVSQVEEFIDSRSAIDWEAFNNRQKDIKNVNAQIEDKQNDEEFIDHCYKTILNMNLPSDDSGKIHWSKFLAQDGDKRKLRDSLVGSFRQAAIEHNKKVQPQIPFESLLLNNGKKNFLIVCPESAGDCLYVSATLKSFRESYPRDEWNLYLATKPEFNELFDLNPYLDKLLPYMDFMQSEIQCIGQGERMGMFQGFCFITAGTQKFLNYLSNNSVFMPI